MQEAWSNVPPALPSLHVTSPLTIEEMETSASVAVNCTLDPCAIDTVFGVTVVVVVCNAFTVREDMPALPEYPLFAANVAVTVTEFDAFVDGVYVTAQLPDESIQEDGLNVPPRFPSLHVTVPVGMF